MGVSTATNGKKMKTLCILLVFGATLIKAYENDFEVVVNDKSYLERSFCCLTTNAQSTCATNCANKDCAATCTVRCGIFMSVCGTYTRCGFILLHNDNNNHDHDHYNSNNSSLYL